MHATWGAVKHAPYAIANCAQALALRHVRHTRAPGPL